MARWRNLAMAVSFRVSLFGGFGLGGERLGAGPAVLGDVEQHAFRPVELLLEVSRLLAAVPLVDVMLGAEALQLLRELLDIFDQDSEMVHAGVVHALAELIALEFENRQVEGAVAEEHAIGKDPIRAAYLLEIECL